MEFVNYLGDKNVVTFMLLLARMSGLIVFFPFFSHYSYGDKKYYSFIFDYVFISFG